MVYVEGALEVMERNIGSLSQNLCMFFAAVIPNEP